MAFNDQSSRRCRDDFPALSRTLTVRGEERPLAFFDGPAGTQVPRRVIDAVGDYYRTSNANTHGTFVTSRETDRVLRDAREAAAAFCGAPDRRTISFGANMTTLTFSLAHALVRTWEPGDEVVITQLDHEANRSPWLRLRERGVRVREVTLEPDGTLDLEDFERRVGERTRLVAVGWAANVVGTVNDVKRMRDRARELSGGRARLLVDAVHYAPHFPVDVADLDPDFLLCSAYKFYGTHVGILYCRPGLLEALPTDKVEPQKDEAPYRIETGTLNHAALAGLTAAIEYLASWGTGDDLRGRLVSAMEGVAAYEHGLARDYHDRVRRIPGVRVHGPGFESPRRAPTVSIAPAESAGWTPREMAEHLAERGIFVWDGDFYAVRAIEVLGLAERGGLLRTGMSMYNTAEEVDRLVEGIDELARDRA
ncbi:MAG: cysteine desulfurase-like protein [Acidobacteriota bacterium]|jgi:cysteine desulfurase family protein (TIGR01976 family)